MVGPSETSVYNFCVLKPCRVPHLGVNIIRKGHDSSRSDDDGWYISSYVSEHNHPLSETSGEKKEWYSHARLDTCAKDMIKYLRDNDSLQRCMTNMIQTWMLRR